VTIPKKSLTRSHPIRRASARAKIQAAHRANSPFLLQKTPPQEPQPQEPLAQEPKCYTVWHSSSRGQPLPFHSFDADYVERLRQGDFPTTQHFVGYFTQLIHVKLRSRLRSLPAIEDVRQETFTRVLLALHKGTIRQPERLGSYVNSMCNNVLRESYRSSQRDTPLEDEQGQDFPDKTVDLFGAYAAKQTKEKVRETLQELREKDRRLLQAIFLEERDKDEVCQELGVTRDHLRLLLYRAKLSFKSKYRKQ
jgi:RNA polymerase sigma-70 factor (ECF subfamily)